MNTRMKSLFTLGALGVITLAATWTAAQINVKSDLSNAIQNIQEIYFSPDGIRNDDESKNIKVELHNGVVRIHGKLLIGQDKTNNIIDPWATGAILIVGSGNHLSGSYNIMLAGEGNEIHNKASNAGIFWGENNKIYTGTRSFIFGGENNKISGTESIIMGGRNNILSWRNNYILAGGFSEVKGNNNIVAGTNTQFKTPRNNLFVWSDNKKRFNPGFSPETDNAFLVRADNGIGIWTTNPQVKGIDIVGGTIQIGDQPWLECNSETNGAIKFKSRWDNKPWCFCTCNGNQWVAMTPSANCTASCKRLLWPKICPERFPKRDEATQKCTR